MFQKIWKKDIYASSYELLQILCLLPSAAVLFALFFHDMETATWFLLYSLIGDVSLLMAVYFLCQFWKQREKILPYHFAFAALVVWAFITTLSAADRYTAFYSTVSRGEGFIGILLYAAFYICGMQFRNEVQREELLRFFVSGSILVGLLYVLQKSETLQTLLGLQSHVFFAMSAHDSSVFSHFNHYGYYLTLVIPAAGGMFIYARDWSRQALALILFTTNTVILVENDTFGCYLAVIAGILMLAVLVMVRERKISWRALLLISIFVEVSVFYNFAAGNVSSNFTSLFHDTGVITNAASSGKEAGSVGTGRGALWSHAWTYIKASPWVGYGPEGLGTLYAADGFGQDRPANEYLQYAGYYGIPGLMLYLSGLLLLFLEKIRKLRELPDSTVILGSMCIAYLCSAFFGNTAFYTTSFFFLFLGML